MGGLALLVLLAGAVVALVLTRDGDSSPYDLPAAIDEGADVAWSAELPEGGSTFGAFVVDGVTIVPLTIAGPGDSDSDEGVVVAYDNGGDEAWRVDLPTRYGSAFGVEDHGLVLVQLDDGMSALRARNGEEQWHVDGVRPAGSLGEDVLIARSVSEDDDESDEESRETTLLLDAGSGDQIAELDGEVVGAAPDRLAVLDGDRLRLVDADGDEQWSTDVGDYAPGSDDVGYPHAILGDDVVAFTTIVWNEDGDDLPRAGVLGLDPGDGGQLWEEEGSVDSLTRTDDGRVVAGRSVDTGEEEVTPLEVFVLGPDGAGDTVRLDDASSLYGVPGHDVLIDYQDGLLIDADDLGVIADRDDEFTGISDDGAYVVDGDRLVLVSWETGMEKYAVALEDEDPAVIPIDGGVLTVDGNTLRLYR